MTRKLFIFLFTLPFIAVFFVTPSIYFIFSAGGYLWILQAFRLHYLGFNFKKILLSYTPFGINTWFRMWEKDSIQNKKVPLS